MPGPSSTPITAFWEYLLWLEIANCILIDRTLHQRDHRLFDPYVALERAYGGDSVGASRPFSERLAALIDRISARCLTQFGDDAKNVSLTDAQVTEIVYDHDIVELKNTIGTYLELKETVWLLIDNLDKGWPAHGLKRAKIS